MKRVKYLEPYYFISINYLELQQELKNSEEKRVLLEQLSLVVQSKLQKLDNQQTEPKLLPKESPAVRFKTKQGENICSPEEENGGKSEENTEGKIRVRGRKRDKSLQNKRWRKSAQLRLYQVGNTSSRKNTEVKQIGPRLAL